ncbi:hypothetical protein CEXT_632911 [Caerostris extrusa]|uniref:Uncharacterized protein n=1 Tax=Caerostris extrusa TaxID=172846 RepID=A0AAV4VVF9_CAEEX|nr:hypothetical protein CEXT_632911 [Caerostris extrusa]
MSGIKQKGLISYFPSNYTVQKSGKQLHLFFANNYLSTYLWASLLLPPYLTAVDGCREEMSPAFTSSGAIDAKTIPIVSLVFPKSPILTPQDHFNKNIPLTPYFLTWISRKSVPRLRKVSAATLSTLFGIVGEIQYSSNQNPSKAPDAIVGEWEYSLSFT